jgi:hypothetical protein
VIAMADMVGSVTLERYQELVAAGRELVEMFSRCQFRLGDLALEVEPLRSRGGSAPAGRVSVEESLGMFAADLDVPLDTVKQYRWVAARWPKDKRVAKVSHRVHMVLASIEDQDERWARIHRPPLDARTATRRWTTALAQREVGQSTGRPESVVEKVNAIHDLAQDEQVAVAVATDLLRRPEITAQVAGEHKVSVIADLARDDQVAASVATDLLRRPRVAARVVEDDTARHLVNRAQVERVQRAAAPVRERSPLAPAFEQVAHTLGYLDLLGVCHGFTAAAGRIVPTLNGRRFTEPERTVLDTNIARVRGAADWIEAAVDTGNASLDEGLAELLRGE